MRAQSQCLAWHGISKSNISVGNKNKMNEVGKQTNLFNLLFLMCNMYYNHCKAVLMHNGVKAIVNSLKCVHKKLLLYLYNT